jgi:hypothetical protein
MTDNAGKSVLSCAMFDEVETSEATCPFCQLDHQTFRALYDHYVVDQALATLRPLIGDDFPERT